MIYHGLLRNIMINYIKNTNNNLNDIFVYVNINYNIKDILINFNN